MISNLCSAFRNHTVVLKFSHQNVPLGNSILLKFLLLSQGLLLGIQEEACVGVDGDIHAAGHCHHMMTATGTNLPTDRVCIRTA